MKERLAAAVSLAAVLLVSAGCGEISVTDPTVTGTAASAAPGSAGNVPPEPSAATVSEARSTLGTIKVKTIPGKDPSYERDAYGDAWSDAAKDVEFAKNGCDTRNDILRRDAVPGTVRTKDGTTGCKITEGVWISQYNGAKYTDKSKVQIDHIIPLARAWASGAKRWSATRRLSFANDPDNLLAVDGSSNQSKSDKGPSAWKPARPFQCSYAVRYVKVLNKYTLPITKADQTALTSMLDGCKNA